MIYEITNHYQVEQWLQVDESWVQHVHEVIYNEETTCIRQYVNGVLQHPMRTLNKKYWPHQFFLHQMESEARNYKQYPALRSDIERWCYDNLKSANWRSYGMVFAFKRQADATLFALRWS
jgi:hypothetical protein